MSATARAPSAVAVVGIHGRFPKAGDLDQFWSNLTHGRDAIDFVPADRWDWTALDGDAAGEGERTHANRGGFTPHVDRFDHGFFGIMPREAQSMDPQQRLFLQAAWSALEDAGYAPSSLAGRKVGVFVGVGNADYPVLMRRDGVPVDIYRGTGIALTAVANRVSFTLGLAGPSQIIDTACSSSLVALHRAVQAIEGGECGMAIAGGVNLLLGPELFIAFAKAGMLSPSGRCRAFDADADGYVRGEGIGAVVLVPLETAEANGDHIYGIVRATAENHGGRAHSFTAPSVNGQAAVVSEAWRKAGLPLHRAALIETHGTGTPLGDPIEVNALKKSLSDTGAAPDGEGRPVVLLGALKSHIGHLEAAAGIAGLIKTLLTLQHRLVPGNLHFRAPNPHSATEGTPLRVAARNTPLGTGDGAIFAGVSSFGFGGVNAHVVVEAGPRPRADALDGTEEERPYLVLLSARDCASLRGRAEQLRRFLARRRTGRVASAEALHASFARALGLGAPFDRPETRDAPLAALGVTRTQFAAALDGIGRRIGRPVRPADLRDHVTLGECVDRLAELARADASGADAGADADAGVLMPAVALPREALDAVTLAGIAHTAMHGRDAMEERLAIVATSLDGLERTLVRFLAGEGEGQAWWRGRARGRKAETPPPADSASIVGWPTVEALSAWAAHWVVTRAAAPQWEALCPGRARPPKIPLPSYPFRLDRVWYEVPARLPAAPASPAPVALVRGRPQIVAIGDARTRLAPDAPADAVLAHWERCWGAGARVP
ncbi:MAG TPA: polyketide synthase, partial [Azospirillum sp.]